MQPIGAGNINIKIYQHFIHIIYVCKETEITEYMQAIVSVFLNWLLNSIQNVPKK